MKTYSEDLSNIENQTVEQCANANFSISYMLLHEVILMEARVFLMEFTVKKKKEDIRMKTVLEKKIDKIHNSTDEDDIQELKLL